jgi:enoyl-CoA hydratase/carnithine racemase
VWIASVDARNRFVSYSWRSSKDSGSRDESEEVATSFHGFANISRRSVTSKPLIAAVNGGAYGGGVEIILNCDIVIASDRAEFALPEVKRGVTAAQGGSRISCYSRSVNSQPNSR